MIEAANSHEKFIKAIKQTIDLNITCMKKLCSILVCISFSCTIFGQILFEGCTNLITGDFPFTLNFIGTTNDGGTIRNSYQAPPSSCSAGVCPFNISWNTNLDRWELSLPGTAVLYYNSTASFPNPPDLSLGTWVSEAGCSPISNLMGDVQSGITVPVQFISLNADMTTNGLILNWETASEIDNERFDVEGSVDGINYVKYGSVKGSGSSSETQNYTFLLRNPASGTVYYRLKQIDFDGQFKYSDVISVKLNRNHDVYGELYPNPNQTGLFKLNFTVRKDKNTRISVFSYTGEKVYTENRYIQHTSKQIELDFTHLKSGIYIVQIGDAQRQIYRKMVIEK